MVQKEMLEVTEAMMKKKFDERNQKENELIKKHVEEVQQKQTEINKKNT